MTIAAAIPHKNGIVICADSQITYPSGLKYFDSKVFPIPLAEVQAIFTFADQANLACEVRDEITQRLASAVKDSGADGLRFTDFYEVTRAVANDYGRLYVEQPLNFLLAVCPKNGNPSVIHFDGKAVTSAHNKVFVIGCGNDTLTKFLVDRLYSLDMDERDALVLGAYLVRKATLYIHGCDGPISMISVNKEGFEIVTKDKIQAAYEGAEREETNLFQMFIRKPFEF